MAERLLYEQRHKEDKHPIANYVMDIDKQMQNLLATRNLTEYDKAVSYIQLLRKYLDALHHDDSNSARKLTNILSEPGPGRPDPGRPSSIPSPPDKEQVEIEQEPTERTTLHLPESIVDYVPKYAKVRAKKFLTVLEQDPNFKWNKKTGEITIGKELIAGSSIKDIVRHASTNPRSIGNTPVGLKSVLAYLKGRNLSNKYILNRTWRKELKLGVTPKKQKDSRPLASWKSPLAPKYDLSSQWESWDS